MTCRIFDTDFWQHLAVGRAIWQQHAIPTRELWIWPTLGEPYVLQSWLFRALLWPLWESGGVLGLQIWRWASTLAVFGLLWLTLRRIGARGLVVLPVLVLAALSYRQRSMPRPETLAAVLMAVQFWLLETARSGGRDRTGWLILVAWIWANAHISYYLGLVVVAAYAVDATWRAWSEARRPQGRQPAALPPPGAWRDARRRWLLLIACIGVSFINPFGARALAEPFQFFFDWRLDPMFRSISEFQPIRWEANSRNGMVLLLVAWPLLLIWRFRRGAWDPAETVLWLLLTPGPILSQRFIGPWVITAGLFVARDLDGWVRSRRWLPWRGSPRVRAAAAVLTCVAFTAIEITRPDYSIGVGLVELNYPEAAADFIERHGIRGHAFNQLEFGGYLLWRFWPDQGRLPFVGNHPEAMRREDRPAYVRALTTPDGWASLDQKYRFDWALLLIRHSPGEHLLDFLDADSTFAMVFMDDVAALYLRRDGPLRPLADALRYRLLPGGERQLQAVDALIGRDAGARRLLEGELRRVMADSPHHVWAASVLVNVLEAEGRGVEAQAMVDSLAPRARSLVLRLTRGTRSR